MGENQSKPSSSYNTPPPIKRGEQLPAMPSVQYTAGGAVPYPLRPCPLPPGAGNLYQTDTNSSDTLGGGGSNRMNAVYRDIPFKLACLLEASAESKSTDDFDSITDAFQHLVSNSTRNYHYDFSLERGVIRNNANN